MSVPSSTFQTDNISNSTATEDAGNRYNVCQRTGFRVKPGELIEDAYGALVRYESFDKRHPQELIRPLAEEIRGPLRPESTDSFITNDAVSYRFTRQSSSTNILRLGVTATENDTIQLKIWVLPNTYRYFGLGVSSDSGTSSHKIWDVITGQGLSSPTLETLLTSSSITSAESGWYELVALFTMDAGTTAVQCDIQPLTAATPNLTTVYFGGSASSGVGDNMLVNDYRILKNGAIYSPSGDPYPYDLTDTTWSKGAGLKVESTVVKNVNNGSVLASSL